MHTTSKGSARPPRRHSPRIVARLGQAVRRVASSRRPRALSALIALALVVLFIADSPGTVAQAAPGTPGVPQDPIVVYIEDFENVSDAADAIFLDAYVGAAPESMTYTADDQWIDGPLCNGLIASANVGPGTTGCAAPIYATYIASVALALGNQFGGGGDNHIMSDVTVSTTGVGTTFETEGTVALPAAGRFIAFSVDVGATSCAAPADPLLDFFLLDGANALPVNEDPIRPCTDPGGTSVGGGNGGVRIGTFATDTAILFAGTELGLRLDNSQGGGSGNDYGVDNIRVLDATPQLDKAFEPTSAQVGETVELVFTITNTSELAAKEGWSFTDTLPSGMTIADPLTTTTTCPNVELTAVAAGTTIEVTGDLETGDASCEVRVAVTSPATGTFENCDTNVTDIIGLSAPACASVTFEPPPPPVFTCTSDSSLFNTGYDGSGGSLPVGSTDASWDVGLADQSAPNTIPSTFIDALVVGRVVAPWTTSPFSDADWVSYFPAGLHPVDENVDMYFRYQFQLDGAVDPASFSLAIDYYADNSVWEVYVNGQPQSGSLADIPQNPGDPYFHNGFGAGNQASVVLGDGWQTGANEIIVHIKSGFPRVGFLAQVTSESLCATQLPPFECTTTAFLSQNTPSDLYEVNVTTGANQQVQADYYPQNVNAIGFNPRDGYIYGWIASGPEDERGIARIGSNFEAENLGYPTNWDDFPGLGAGHHIGEVDDDGHYWMSNGNYWVEIDLAPGSPTFLEVLRTGPIDAPTNAHTFADWAFNPIDGRLYTVASNANNRRLWTFNRSNGSMAQAANLGQIAGGSGFGALYSDAGGNLFASLNSNGRIYHVNLNTNQVQFLAPGPPAGLSDGAICFEVFQPPVEDLGTDFGDAPDTYLTTLAMGGPSHDIASGIMLGASIDAEDDGQPSPAADGDDTTGADDEDGVAFNPGLGYPNPTLRTGIDPGTGSAARNEIVVDASVPGFVSVWIDWDLDGQFGAGEQIANAQPVSGGANTITFSRGLNPPASWTYVRVRYSTDASSVASPGGSAPNGEVEDYRVLVERYVQAETCEMSDSAYYAFTFLEITERVGAGLPGSSARFPNASVIEGVPVDLVIEVIAGRMQVSGGGAAPPNGFRLSGDDAAWQIRGAAALRYTFYESGTTTPVAINAVFTANDLDASEAATFDAGELAGYSVTQGSGVVIIESGDDIIFDGTVNGNFAPTQRFQVVFENTTSFEATWKGGNGSGFGFDGDGDSQIGTPSCEDYGDAPAGYGTLLAGDGPRHRVTPGGPTLGSLIDIDSDGQAGAGASGDDSNNDDDEDAIDSFPPLLDTDASYSVTLACTGSGAVVAGWIDFNQDGTFANDERDTGSCSDTGEATLMWNNLSSTVAGETYARFRIGTSISVVLPGGAADDGEVEDYALFIDEAFPAFLLTKTADAAAQQNIELGQEITYSFQVENVGELPLRIELADQLEGLSPIACPGTNTNVIEQLGVGNTVTCTATYIVTDEDIVAGSIVNSATADGCFEDRCVTTPPSEVEVPTPVPNPDLTAEKVADEAAELGIEVGQVITYTIRVTNTGNVTMSNIGVSDELEGISPIDCGDGNDAIASLAPGASAGCTATYVVTQGDVDAGEVVNTATVNGCFQPDLCDEETIEKKVPGPEQNPDHTLDKFADPAAYDAIEAGQVITYTFRATNTGNVTLTGGIEVTDELPGLSPIDCGDGTNLVPAGLAPGEYHDCHATYVVTQDDVDNGEIVNAAVACRAGGSSATQSAGDDCDEGETKVPGPDPNPDHEIDKLADEAAEEAIEVGQTISYTFVVTNTGNVTLTGIEVADPLPGLSPIDCGDGTNLVGALAPGQSHQCTAAYVVTQQDVDNGAVVNTATAIACFGDDCEPTTTTRIVPGPDPDPAHTLDKFADPAAYQAIEAGQVITYTFRVTNTGNVTLAGAIEVADELAGLSPIDCGDGTNLVPAGLAPGEYHDCTATYVVTQQDVDTGEIVNTAMACRGDDCEEGETKVPGPDPDPAHTLDKFADPAAYEAIEVGQVITYTFRVTNTGNVTLTGVVVTDALAGLSPIDCGDGTNMVGALAPGESHDCTAIYVVTPGDVNNGEVTNIAVARACFGADCTETEDRVTVPGPDPRLRVEKIADAAAYEAIDVGQVVTYTFIVTNTGNVALTDIEVLDPMTGSDAIDCGDGTNVIPLLEPGQSVECSASYTVSGFDAERGFIENNVSVTGCTGAGSCTTAVDSTTVPGTPPVPEPPDTEPPIDGGDGDGPDGDSPGGDGPDGDQPPDGSDGAGSGDGDPPGPPDAGSAGLAATRGGLPALALAMLVAVACLGVVGLRRLAR